MTKENTKYKYKFSLFKKYQKLAKSNNLRLKYSNPCKV